MMHKMGSGRLPDPSWKSGPPDPPAPHSEHLLRDPAMDIDGVGRSEAEEIEGEPLLAVREAYPCTRDGCEADIGKVHLYSMLSVSERLKQVLSYVSEYDEVEYFAENAVVVDYDETPVLGVHIGDHIYGYVYPQQTKAWGFDSPCYGHQEPNPDLESYRYDL